MLEAAVAAKTAATRLHMLLHRIEYLAGRGDEQAAKLAKKLRTLQLALERVSVRLETLAYTGVASVEELSTIREVLRMLDTEYRGVLPGLETVLSDIEALVVEAATTSGIELEPSEPSSKISEEAKRIIEEARIIAEERSSGNAAASQRDNNTSFKPAA